MRFKIEGIISAMITPFTKGGNCVDLDKVGAVAERLVKGGVHGLFPCGTTGEGMLMSPAERMEVIEEVIGAVGKKTKVIAHTGSIDLATTIELTCHACDSGAYAAAIVAPGFYTYDESALEQYYRAIAKEAADFPLLLYNIPGCAKNALSAELILRLAHEVENIVGIKDSSGNMALLTRLLGNAPKGFYVVNGADDYGFQAFMAGAPGAVSGTSNLGHEIYTAVYDHYQKGRIDKAWKEQIRLEKLCRIVEYGKNIAVFKEGLRLRGFDAGHVRPPMRQLTAAEKKKLAKDLESIGLL
jgi:dihydrodipicolinate synthase/N-acetylneuraminate lyase